MIEQLFGSKTRVKLLQMFYSNPNRSFYVREITRKIDEQINSVRRELANLLNTGIITSDSSNNKVYYEVDQKYEFYAPLQEIFGGGGAKPRKTGKTTKVADAPVEEAADLKALGNVEVACLLEKQEGKDLRYTVFSLDDFTYRLQIKDRFLSNVLRSKKQVLLDKPGLLS
jgi:hypothetical protein